MIIKLSLIDKTYNKVKTIYVDKIHFNEKEIENAYNTIKDIIENKYYEYIEGQSGKIPMLDKDFTIVLNNKKTGVIEYEFQAREFENIYKKISKDIFNVLNEEIGLGYSYKIRVKIEYLNHVITKEHRIKKTEYLWDSYREGLNKFYDYLIKFINKENRRNIKLKDFGTIYIELADEDKVIYRNRIRTFYVPDRTISLLDENYKQFIRSYEKIKKIINHENTNTKEIVGKPREHGTHIENKADKKFYDIINIIKSMFPKECKITPDDIKEEEIELNISDIKVIKPLAQIGEDVYTYIETVDNETYVEVVYKHGILDIQCKELFKIELIDKYNMELRYINRKDGLYNYVEYALIGFENKFAVQKIDNGLYVDVRVFDNIEKAYNQLKGEIA